GHRFGEADVDASGLGGEAAVGDVYVEDLVHADGGDDNPAAYRRGAAAEARARSARQERHVQPVAKFDNGCDLFRTLREGDGGGRGALDGVGVTVVDAHLRPVRQDRFRTDDSAQLAGELS